MANEMDYDFFVIGAGSGGVRASRVAAGFGARVAVAEMGKLGGTCVNVGCIPKKLLVYASEYSKEVVDASGYGWTVGEATHDWPTLIANKDREIERLNGIYGKLLEGAGVTLIRGHARLVDANTVEVDGKRYTSKYILVATGGKPFLPPGEGCEHVITSDEAFVLPERPERVLVVGGGYIAVEFAGIFHGLGSKVTLLHRREKVLRGFDEDVQTEVTDALREQGIELRMSVTVTRVERVGDVRIAHLDDGTTIEADQIMMATGRVPLVDGLGLQDAGVDLDRSGAIIVDDYSRTSVPNIFAVGDVTDRINLTPVALNEGTAVAQTLFNDTPTRPDHSDVPSAVFSQPNVATVGLTEAEARSKYGQVRIYRSSLRELKHTLSGREERAYMKLIVDDASDRVIGLHMVGDHAGDVVQGFAVAIKMGATKADFDRTIGIHPTAAEEFVTMREKRPDHQSTAAG